MLANREVAVTGELQQHPLVSVVVPTYNEVDNVEALYEEIVPALSDYTWELLFIDDGSTDGTWERILKLLETDGRVRGIRFKKNFGKSEALRVGFHEASGDIVITMDADLQDDPREIPRFVEAINEGYDMVNGWRAQRRDPLGKSLPSKLFNFILNRTVGLSLHDFNCGFKAYLRPLVAEVSVYGDLHRYMPALAHWRGFAVTEIPVNHRPRARGRSKFGVSRFVGGLLDLFTVLFLTRFGLKPLHLFGSLGAIFSAAGAGICIYLTVLWFNGEPIGQRPLLMLGVLLIITGIQLFIFGLVAEMVARLGSHNGSEGKHYEIRVKTPGQHPWRVRQN